MKLELFHNLSKVEMGLWYARAYSQGEHTIHFRENFSLSLSGSIFQSSTITTDLKELPLPFWQALYYASSGDIFRISAIFWQKATEFFTMVTFFSFLTIVLVSTTFF